MCEKKEQNHPKWDIMFSRIKWRKNGFCTIITLKHLMFPLEMGENQFSKKFAIKLLLTFLVNNLVQNLSRKYLRKTNSTKFRTIYTNYIHYI